MVSCIVPGLSGAVFLLMLILLAIEAVREHVLNKIALCVTGTAVLFLDFAHTLGSVCRQVETAMSLYLSGACDAHAGHQT